MSDRPNRLIPLVSGLGYFAVVAAILFVWRPQHGTIWWYVRALPFVVFFYLGCTSLWDAFVTPDETLNRRLKGEFKN